jgi:hypothetical protein
MPFKFRLAAISLLLLLTSCATTSPPSFRVNWVGTYTATLDSRVPAPDSIVGTRAYISAIQLLQETRRVKAELGTRFGFEYVVTGPKPGTMTKLRARNIFPPGGLTNPSTGRNAAVDEREVQCLVGAKCLNGRSFSEAWELVPGIWTFELLLNGEVVVSREFEVFSQ